MGTRKPRRTRKVNEQVETHQTEVSFYVRFLLSRLRDLYIENVVLKLMLDTLQAPLPDFIRQWRKCGQTS